MKIAIFENEYSNVKASFDAFNLLNFNNEAIIKVFEHSQSLDDYNTLKAFDFILIDLDLSSTSELDGYKIIGKLLEIDIPLDKLIILTGHVNVEDKLKENNLPILPILEKPITLDELENKLLVGN
jgi:CheY-like chemotaxis protein